MSDGSCKEEMVLIEVFYRCQLPVPLSTCTIPTFTRTQLILTIIYSLWPLLQFDAGHGMFAGGKKIATKTKRWYKDVGLGFKTPNGKCYWSLESIESAYRFG